MRDNYAYYQHLPLKTRLLNALRSAFHWSQLEHWLAERTRGLAPNTGWARCIPPEYTYDPGTWRTVERNGFRLKLDLSDAVDHYLYFGLAEPGFDRLVALVKPDSHVIDVGANIGMLTLPLARAASAGRVVAFEPDPANRARLTEHISMNALTNVKVMAMGLGSEQRVHRLYKVVDSNAGMNRIVLDDPSSDRFPFSEIQVERLDGLLPTLGLDRVDLIKIDVEGFEHEVLKGAEATLRDFHPTLFVELDDDNLRENGSSAAALIGWLSERGYAINAALTGSPLDVGRLDHCHLDVLAVHRA